MSQKVEDLKLVEELHVPAGFRFGAHASGIKSDGKLDVAVLIAEQLCVTHGAFTQNLVRASSVDWNESRVGAAQGLVINSGNANACTGEQGQIDTAEMAATLAGGADCDVDHVMVMSTGIIGEAMPMQNVTSGIEFAVSQAGDTESSVSDFAEAILTTDSFPKICSRKVETKDGDYSILGIAKGAGMIGPRMLDPRMATMLCVLVTDFPLPDAEDAYKTNGKRFQQVVEKNL